MNLPVDSTDIALFMVVTRVTIRDGRKASFWSSSWIDGHSPASLYPLLCQHSRRKKRSVRDALLNGKWINDVAYDLNTDLLKEFFDLWRHARPVQLQLQRSDDQAEDQIVWTLESSGEYSVKSAYAIQFCGQIASNFPKLIWTAWATPRCKFFLWFLLQNRLWTAARLQLRGWENNYFCALCGRSLETATHLFIECPYTCKVWELVACWSNNLNLSPSAWTEWRDLEGWFLALTERGTKSAHSIAIATLWHLWKQRNAIVFNGERVSEQTMAMKIKDECLNWASARGGGLSYLRNEQSFMSN